METAQASLPAFHLLAKPSGAACNLSCQYCFYLSKESLYPDSHFRMSDELLELYIRQLLEAQPSEAVVAWQGGEPTLMGLDFFKRSIQYVEKYRRPGQKVSYTLQTNGTRVDSQWTAFFKEHGFLVGLSLDGPEAMHDVYRVDKAGRGSFRQVRRGWETLREQGVDLNILCAVHAGNADHPLEVYRYFRDELEAQFIQFIPIVEQVATLNLPEADQIGGNPGIRQSQNRQVNDEVSEFSVRAEQYGRFLISIFDEWVRRDVGKVFVQMFDVTLGSWMGMHSLCVFAPVCGNALALEHNGDVYACDHFVEPDFLLGNIRETHLVKLIFSPKQKKFGETKQAGLPQTCRECDVRFACYGGCLKDRFLRTVQGEPGLNYLCEGYRLFFRHVAQPMAVMADLLRRGHAAGEIMNILAIEELRGLQPTKTASETGLSQVGSTERKKKKKRFR